MGLLGATIAQAPANKPMKLMVAFGARSLSSVSQTSARRREYAAITF
jgi:hypothetical protein